MKRSHAGQLEFPSVENPMRDSAALLTASRTSINLLIPAIIIRPEKYSLLGIDGEDHSAEGSNLPVTNLALRKGYEALLTQDLKTRQTELVGGNASYLNAAQNELPPHLLYGQSFCTKIKQFGRKQRELTNFRLALPRPANGKLYRLLRDIMQRASLPQSPDNLL